MMGQGNKNNKRLYIHDQIKIIQAEKQVVVSEYAFA
jgi:hypothetical protein